MPFNPAVSFGVDAPLIKQERAVASPIGSNTSSTTIASEKKKKKPNAAAASATSTAADGVKKGRRSPKKWSLDETDCVFEGVLKHGFGRWTMIHRDPAFKSRFDPTRTPTDIKDKFRTRWPDKYHEMSGKSSEKIKDLTKGTDMAAKKKSAGNYADKWYDSNVVFVKHDRRPANQFTKEEEKMLRLGVQRHGNNWTAIMNDSDLGFEGKRSSQNLRDRYRLIEPDTYTNTTARRKSDTLVVSIKSARRSQKNQSKKAAASGKRRSSEVTRSRSRSAPVVPDLADSDDDEEEGEEGEEQFTMDDSDNMEGFDEDDEGDQVQEEEDADDAGNDEDNSSMAAALHTHSPRRYSHHVSRRNLQLPHHSVSALPDFTIPTPPRSAPIRTMNNFNASSTLASSLSPFQPRHASFASSISPHLLQTGNIGLNPSNATTTTTTTNNNDLNSLGELFGPFGTDSSMPLLGDINPQLLAPITFQQDSSTSNLYF
ncbi:hypothetical protein GQ42DRAFT_160012 [Ramicandelaber brevisporus]|nr:hypothetical protein GQ42DRAFT_160012 [Ramicandelaber brevisporus]